MIVLGLDPSLTAYGWALVDVTALRVLAVGCVRTAPTPKKKRHLYQTDEDSIRLKAIGEELQVRFAFPGLQRVVCEAPAGAQHAKAAKALGQTLGLTIGLALRADAPGASLRFVQAHEVKIEIGGGKNATKNEVAGGVFALTGWRSTATSADAREGESDAIAVALTLRHELQSGAR